MSCTQWKQKAEAEATARVEASTTAANDVAMVLMMTSQKVMMQAIIYDE